MVLVILYQAVLDIQRNAYMIMYCRGLCQADDEVHLPQFTDSEQKLFQAQARQHQNSPIVSLVCSYSGLVFFFHIPRSVWLADFLCQVAHSFRLRRIHIVSVLSYLQRNDLVQLTTGGLNFSKQELCMCHRYLLTFHFPVVFQLQPEPAFRYEYSSLKGYILPEFLRGRRTPLNSKVASNHDWVTVNNVLVGIGFCTPATHLARKDRISV